MTSPDQQRPQPQTPEPRRKKGRPRGSRRKSVRTSDEFVGDGWDSTGTTVVPGAQRHTSKGGDFQRTISQYDGD